jgi:hypothetical protein
MGLSRFSKRLTLKFHSVRNSVIHSYLRDRNLRVVKNQWVRERTSEGKGILPTIETVRDVAEKCFLEHGYFPISFSWPGNFSHPRTEKTSAVSATVPYVAYSFESSEEYYENYSRSALAITQKKGGWDCFRHLEIMAAGCVPLFLGAEKIPTFTMIHYPKLQFRDVYQDYIKRSYLPTYDVSLQLMHYANEHLTSHAMCIYFSDLSKFEITMQDTILFVDSSLSLVPDYLSIFNFIGLKQVYGNQVQCLFDEPDYVFSDSGVDVSKLYGRGFGYSKVLKRSKTRFESRNQPKVVVVSNLERDFEILAELKMEYPASKFVMFWGADEPIPTQIKEHALRLTNGVLFCREIY